MGKVEGKGVFIDDMCIAIIQVNMFAFFELLILRHASKICVDWDCSVCKLSVGIVFC